jgi:ribosomal protein S5
MEAAGYRNVVAKTLGSRNHNNVIRAPSTRLSAWDEGITSRPSAADPSSWTRRGIQGTDWTMAGKIR